VLQGHFDKRSFWIFLVFDCCKIVVKFLSLKEKIWNQEVWMIEFILIEQFFYIKDMCILRANIAVCGESYQKNSGSKRLISMLILVMVI
jgi:hypothetical protein